MISLTAQGSGYYRVFVDGVQFSQHLQEREAAEAVVRLEAENPARVVEYDHDYRVVVEESDPPVEIASPVEFRLVCSDPTAVQIDGLRVTPLRDAVVSFWVELV